MDDITGTTTPSPAPSRPPHTTLPFREDCWSEEATQTLVEAWGDRYLELNRGNLRQKHWQEVADAVNARHGHVKKARRTDIQCKNRIDTLKKKYKIEKAKASESNGPYLSPWPFFARLDTLIGNTLQQKKPSPAPTPPLPYRKSTQSLALMSPIPVAPRSATVKRPSPVPISVDDSYFRRNFSAFAAAAAAEADDDSDSSRSRSSAAGSRRRDEGKIGEMEGYKELAQAIGRFGDIYERVEGSKQRQMVELEKQRMQFAKDLEVQRMKLFVDMQLQLEKIKRAKRSNGADSYS